MAFTRTLSFAYTLLLLLCITSGRSAYAQLPTWDWVHQSGGSAKDVTSRPYISPEGDVYVPGAYDGVAQFGSFTLSATHQTGYLARYDSAGSVLWVREFPASISSAITSVTSDSNGNVYIIGQFTGQITLGNQTFTSISTTTWGLEGFMAKMSPAGTIEWAEHLQGRRRSPVPYVSIVMTSVVFDPTGGLYVAGFCTDSLYFGHQAAVAGGGAQNAFLFRIDPQQHQLMWLTVADGAFRSYAWDMQSSPQGGVILSGNFNGSIRFGSSFFNSGSGSCAFLARYDANGAFQWLRKSDASGTNNSFCRANNAIESAVDQSTFLCGYFIGQVSFNGNVLPNTTPGDSHAFITKYGSGGNVEWVQASTGGAFADASGLASDDSGNLYVSGNFRGMLNFGSRSLTGDPDSLNGYLMKLNPQGTPQWLLRVGAASATTYILGIRLSPLNQRLYVNGMFANSVSFGSTTLVSAGGSDIFLARLSVGIPLGSSEALEAGGWNVVPNPVLDGRITLNWPSQMQPKMLQLMDMTGRTVYKQAVSSANAGHLELTLPPLAPGLYSLQAIQDGKQTTLRRIVISQ